MKRDHMIIGGRYWVDPIRQRQVELDEQRLIAEVFASINLQRADVIENHDPGDEDRR